jgi:hypothetical protein
MKRILWLTAMGIVFTYCASHAQDPTPIQISSYALRLARILTKDGVLRAGWLLGTRGDTLLAQIRAKQEPIVREDLVRVEVASVPRNATPPIVGALLGVYAGNALALKADTQPFLFIRSNEQGPFALYSALFGAVGSLIGYLVGNAAQTDVIFDFTGDDDSRTKAWEDLTESGSRTRLKRDFHFALEGAWISGPLPYPESDLGWTNASYGYAGASRLNMVRKVQLTYTLNDFFDAGLACLWLGQPSVSYYLPGLLSSASLSLEGNGEYAVGVFQPLWKLGWRTVQWDVGGGLGIASYDFNTNYGPDYSIEGLMRPGRSEGQSTTTFSTLLFTEFKLFLADYFSLGVTADWAYIPDKVPDVKGIPFASRQLSTTSIGFVLTLHIH